MNILKILIITIIIAVSFLVVSFNPKMHKQVRVENADFDLVQFLETKKDKPLPPVNTIKNQAKKAAEPKYLAPPAEVPRQNESPSEVSAPPVTKPPPKPQPPVVSEPQAVKTPQPQPQPPKAEKPLTEEQEEIIAWNKWRSDLQNQAMKDSRIMAPVGTKFSFSFTVDKFGNISNLRIWAEPAAYTSIGLKALRPVLLGYQGQPILNFPPKSKRIIVNIEGRFYMSRTSKFSTPGDYSDYERVK